MPKTTRKTKCSYCGKNDFYLYHRDNENNPDWAVCFKCMKKAMDNALGEGKDGGRVEHRKD